MTKSAAKTTDLVVPDGKDFLVLQEADDFKDIVEANMGGEQLSVKMLNRLVIPAGGSTMWMVPGPDGEEPQKTVEGVIVHMQTIRTYWKEAFSGQGTPPDCYSPDAKLGIGDPGGNCLTCPMNQFMEGGGAKACAEKIMLFYMPKDGYLPAVILVPPGSLRATKQYLVDLIQYHKTPKNLAVTRFELEQDTNNGGIKFSKLKYSFGGRVAKDDEPKWKMITGQIAQMVGGISTEELTSAVGE